MNVTINSHAFFALPVNILLGMVTDPRLDVRKAALDKILKAREEEQDHVAGEVRYNIVPNLNFEAQEYTEMIHWGDPDVSITVPPVLRHMTTKELTDDLIVEDGIVPEWTFTQFPCHTVAVERTVKLVTEASSKYIGVEARDRNIRSTLLSRQVLPKFDSKSQLLVS